LSDYLTNTNQWPEHAAAPNTHNRVFELLLSHLPAINDKRICDLPCGAGAFSARLAQAGAQVTAVDLEAVSPFYFDESHRVLADANKALPFADGEFDAMVSIEGIEHLENPSFFVRECARIVRPGGLVIISTPNVDSYRSRRSVHIHGFHKYFKPVGEGQKMAWHLLPVDMVFMFGALRKAGLDVVEIAVNRKHGKGIVSELLRPVFNRKLPPELRGEIPYYGEVIIYVLRKPLC